MNRYRGNRIALESGMNIYRPRPKRRRGPIVAPSRKETIRQLGAYLRVSRDSLSKHSNPELSVLWHKMRRGKL